MLFCKERPKRASGVRRSRRASGLGRRDVSVERVAVFISITFEFLKLHYLYFNSYIKTILLYNTIYQLNPFSFLLILVFRINEIT